MDSMTVIKRAQITYRQLDHWVHRGWIQCSEVGTGHPRDISIHEADVAAHMGRLIRAGFTTETAAVIARDLADGQDVVQLPGYRLIPLIERTAS